MNVQSRTTLTQDSVAVLVGFWLAVGLFIDGWAHNNLRGLETFFTPWHAILYSGFGACAIWYLGLPSRAVLTGRVRGAKAIPVGYGWGVAGIFIFAFGGLGDLVWHLAFGIEQGIDALFSPTHLVLATGLITILGAPLRAAYLGPTTRRVQTRWALVPALISTTSVCAVLGFFFMHAWPPIRPFYALRPIAFAVVANGGDFKAASITAGVGGMIVMTVVMVGGTCILVGRWRLPFGSVTALFGVVATLMAGIGNFALWEQIPAQAVAGLVADLWIQRFDPAPARPGPFRAFAVGVALVLWTCILVTDGNIRGISWSREVIGGSLFWSAGAAFAVAVLMTPLRLQKSVVPLDTGEA